MKSMMCSRCKQRPAVVFLQKMENGNPVQEGLCLKCAMELDIPPVKQMMEQMGLTPQDVDDAMEQMTEMMSSMGDDFEAGGAPVMPFLNSILGGNMPTGTNSAENSPSAPAAADEKTDTSDKSDSDGKKRSRKKDKKKSKRKFLNVYCTDLTARAKSGKIDRIIGRDSEIARAVQILCRRTKNNPCLIGEPGVGKTAVAEGLALRIAAGDVPAKLADKEIHLLDLTALVAGTQFRGQFESRIKGLIEEVKAEGNIILFIDEVHNLVGTGDAEGTMNAANILKPALSRGEIQVVGATTFNEYRKHIEKDAALERRFQPVKIDEPSIADVYKMLKGIREYYENYHKVKISDELLYKTVTLSERYIQDRFLPDKAIDLLDEACTCANLRNKAISDYESFEKNLAELKADEEDLMAETENVDYEELARVRSELMVLQSQEDVLKEKASDNAVTEDDIANVIQLWTGIPARKVIDSDLNKLSSLESNLKSRIVGQDKAVESVVKAIKRTRIQLNPVRRPASFIFVGPTGVGKTELVKQVAAELFDTPETLIRLDMSEFMEKHSVSRLIGSPPGYVGYDEAGQLTEKVRRKPYSVILFDEIEKAHPDVMNILLQILDEGKTNDAQGRTVNFANSVIIMTSNAGSENRENAMGFAKSSSSENYDKAMKSLREFLRPEFIGRVDEIVVFNQLTKDDCAKIAKILVDEFRPALKDKGIELTVEDNVYDVIADMGFGGSRGARDIRNVIRREIEDKIADIIIESKLPVDKINISADNNTIFVA